VPVVLLGLLISALMFYTAFELIREIEIGNFTSYNQTVSLFQNQESSIDNKNITNTSFDILPLSNASNIPFSVETSAGSPVSNTSLLLKNISSLKYVNITAPLINSSNTAWIFFKIYYSDDEISSNGLIESTLGMYFYNSTSNDWEKLQFNSGLTYSTGLNTTGKFLYANVSHLSVYAAGGLKNNGIPCVYNSECFSGICCSSVCSSSCSSSSPVSSSQSAAGGAGGSATGGNLFNVDQDAFNVEVLAGGAVARKITITNGNLPTVIEIKNEIKDFLSTEENSFSLNPGETREISLVFFANRNQAPGLYSGKIVLSSPSYDKPVYFIISVKPPESLFDMKVRVLPQAKTVTPGEFVQYELTLFNLGTSPRIDATSTTRIVNLETNESYEPFSEAFAVETQVTLFRSPTILLNSSPLCS